MPIVVPSFASFPDFDQERNREPQSSLPKQGRDGPSEDTKTQDRTRRSKSPKRLDKRRKHEKPKHKSKDKGEDKHREREERRQRDSIKTRDEHAHLAQEDDSYRLFFVDRKPDLLNVQYGGLHQGDVPKYRLVAGGRRVLGLSPAFVVVRRLGKGIEIGLANSRKMSSISDSRTKSLLALPPTRRLVGDQLPDKYQEVDGFIHIPTRRRKSGPDDTYRSIINADDVDSSASDSDDSYSSDAEDWQDENTLESSHQAHLRTLEQRLLAEPDSVETWLSLLDRTISSIPINSKNATKARSDIALSVLSRAISAHPRNNVSKTLRIKYLKAGEEIWQDNQLSEEWEKALKIGGVEIWMEWLEWRLKLSKREFNDFIEDVGRALAAFGDSEEDQLAKLRIFWRTAVATQSAGYSERAFAMFQAQAELIFNTPLPLAESSFEQQLDELEQFWESETTRLFEEGAKGWKSWHSSGKPECQFAATTVTQAPEHIDLDPYRQWSAREIAADKAQFFPSRTTIDDSDNLDPYSAILFSDIRPILIQIKSQRVEDAFRLVLLSFFGLHLPGFSQSLTFNDEMNWDDRWTPCGLSSTTHLEAIFPNEHQSRATLTEAVSGVIVAREKEYNDSFGPIKHWGFGVFQPLDVFFRRGHVTRQWLWSSMDTKGLDVHFIRKVFSQLRKAHDDFVWDSFALAFETTFNVKNALKLSKAFLSEHQDALEYWTAHAQLERIHGKLDNVRKVYQTVLIASRPSNSRKGFSQMWWNWAEMEWLTGQNDQALAVILQSAGVSKISEVGILRAKQSLRESIETSFESLDKETWLKLYALLELLRGEDIPVVLALFDEFIDRTTDKLARERLVTTSLLFIYYHRVILNNPLPPVVLRLRATRALEEYPSNSVVLGVFLEAEKGQGIWGRVRSKLQGGGDGMARSIARVMEEVWVAGWEKGRWASEVERTRNGLATAVEHERTRASAVIWRIYIEFEIRVGQLKNAKKLLFRAIGDCPFAKELYLLAFSRLRSVFDGQELRSLADLMVERGLRLRHGLNEDIEFGEKDGTDNRISEEGAIDEVEYNAQELRRLMPY